MIAPHLKEGSYGSWEKYFNILFYLEKEDCYKSLRTSIHHIMNNHIDLRTIKKENRDLYYYKKVEIVSIDITSKGIFITLDFEAINQHITFTKRMIFGNPQTKSSLTSYSQQYKRTLTSGKQYKKQKFHHKRTQNEIDDKVREMMLEDNFSSQRAIEESKDYFSFYKDNVIQVGIEGFGDSMV